MSAALCTGPDVSTRAAVLPSLTGLRALAAGAVFVFHVAVVRYVGGGAGGVLSAVAARAGTGVSLFFVLSGFVLAWSHDARTGSLTFLRRRFARVWPAHAVWVVAAVAATAAVPAIRHAGQGPVPDLANLALVSAWVPAWWQAGNPVAWSLVCEAFFYAAFPLLWWAFSRVRGRSGWVALAGSLWLAVWLAPAVVRWTGIAGSVDAATHHPLARWPEFALGVVAAVVLRRGLWRGPGLRTAVVVAVGAYVLASVLAPDRATETGLLVVPHVLLVAALARRDLVGRRTGLGGRVVVHLGEISYAFYLCHLLVIGVLGAAWPGGHPRLPVLPAAGLALLALTVSLALAEVTHRLVERPARRWLLRSRGLRGAGVVGP